MKKSKLKVIILMIITLLLITKNVYADDYPDDIYDGDYSIEDMLRNYSVVTFGQKNYDSNATKLNGQLPGSLQIFHIIGNFIVKGNLVAVNNSTTYGNTNPYSYAFSCYQGSPNSYWCNNYFGAGTAQLSSNSLDENRHSYIENSFINSFMCLHGKVFSKLGQSCDSSPNVGTYINIERLYDNIIEKQSKIAKGRHIDSNEKNIHIEIGGNYYIDNINNIDSIIFDNFENNENELTTITITDTGAINIPKIYDTTIDSEGIIPTNDSYDSTKPNNSYPGNYVLTKYKGNIIWNIPNATYIKVPTNPFVGHLIAPNADVEGEEFHFAGAFLVNSLAVEGNTEAHFYPLTKNSIPYRSSNDNYKAIPKISKKNGTITFQNAVNEEELEEGMVVSFKVDTEKGYLLSGIEIKDEEGNIVEFKEIGDGEYEFTMPATNVTITPQFKEKNIKNTIEQVITNPKTGSNFFIVLSIIISFIIGFRKIKKEKIS